MNYDFSGFHPNCKSKQLCLFPDGPHIVCLDCGVSGNVEAISDKISPQHACRVGKVERTVTGKRSENVNKGKEVTN